jgi:glycosyltransferase involved in cell wall biosynthesis
MIPWPFRGRTRVQLAVGTDPLPLASAPKRIADAPLELLYAGKFRALKGLPIALRALAILHQRGVNCRLTLVGGGAERARLERLAKNLGVAGQLRWRDWMPRAQVLSVYRDADIFVFPSLHDSGGLAVLEALAAGLPVVALDCGGPGVIVDASCGRSVACQDKGFAAVIEAFAEAIWELRDPATRAALGAGIQHRVEALSWARQVAALYGASAALSTKTS